MKSLNIFLILSLFIGCSIGKYRAKVHYEKFKDGKYHYNFPNAPFDSYRGHYIRALYDISSNDIKEAVIKRLENIENDFKKHEQLLNDSQKVRDDINKKLEKVENTFNKIENFDNELIRLKEFIKKVNEKLESLKNELERVKNVIKGL